VPEAILEGTDIPPRPLDERSMSLISKIDTGRRPWWRRR